MPRPRTPASPFRYFNSSPEVIRLAVLLHVKHPLSLRNIEDLSGGARHRLSHETVRYWWNRFGHCLQLAPPSTLSCRSYAVSRLAYSPDPLA